MSTSAFNSSDDIIDKKITCSSSGTPSEAIGDVYEIERCTWWISQNKFKMVALQFPDELLVDAPQLTNVLLLHNPDVSFFVLGDTTYGSCCVDEIGAQHYKADSIIHFGGACLSPTSRLHVLYIFGKSELDVDDSVVKIQALLANENESSNLISILVYDTNYQHKAEQVFNKLNCHQETIVLSELIVENLPHGDHSCVSRPVKCASCDRKENPCSVIAKCGRVFHLPSEGDMDKCRFIFIGSSESPTLTNMMMTFNKNAFYTYNPEGRTCYRETLNVNKALMKRYYLIERAKDANIIGIVVGTLGVVRYKDIIDHLKILIQKAGKKSYTFVVGKLNPAKLANFAEIDIFVLVACSESSLLDHHDFYKPVATPFEMEIACNRAREWTGDYSTDFSELLPGAAMYVDSKAKDNDEEKGDVSLISNKIRILGVKNTPEVGMTGSVALRDNWTVSSSSQNAGEFFAGRSWKGLEQKLGETPVDKATEGQSGIAMSYEHETNESS